MIWGKQTKKAKRTGGSFGRVRVRCVETHDTQGKRKEKGEHEDGRHMPLIVQKNGKTRLSLTTLAAGVPFHSPSLPLVGKERGRSFRVGRYLATRRDPPSSR